jgi:E3 ubiquitin-protein ligase UBR7
VAKTAQGAQEDDSSTTSDSELPPPLISTDDYDVMICRACVDSIPIVKRYAGTPGAMVVIRDDADSKWKIIGVFGPTDDEEVDVGTKRPRPADTTEEEKVDSKRAKASTSDVSTEKSSLSLEPCLAPSSNTTVAKILASAGRELGTIDVFLTDGWRTRWCRCKSVKVFGFLNLGSRLIPVVCSAYLPWKRSHIS